MGVIADWSTFRWIFSRGGATSNWLHGNSSGFALTFAAGPPATIAGGGTFIADHHAAEMHCDVSATALNNGRYLIDTVAAGLITLDSAETLQAEVVAATLFSAYRDNDQVEEFPSELGHVDLMRDAGFDLGIGQLSGAVYGRIRPYTGSAFEASCNALAADAVKGTDEYHWYLSQRTDDPAKQYLSIAQKADTAAQSFSGSVSIVHTAFAVSDLDLTAATIYLARRELFGHCDLYCQRIADGAIQWIRIYNEMMLPQ